MTRVLHRNAAEGWARLELVEQLGNDVPPDSARGIRRYFFGFAWAARRFIIADSPAVPDEVLRLP